MTCPCCTVSSRAWTKTGPRCRPASICPTATEPPKASTTKRNSSNARPTDAPASRCSANESCSADQHKAQHYRLRKSCKSHFFYVTTRTDLTAEQIVQLANERCDQENIIGQLKSGINALRVPLYD